MSSVRMSQDDILEKITAERARQDNLFGDRNRHVSPTDFMWVAICAEQVGKACSTLQYINMADTPPMAIIEAYETELIKTAASCVQAIERIQALKSTDVD